AIAPRRDLLGERARALAFLGLVHRLDVAAGTEPLAGAGDDDDADVRIDRGPGDRVEQVVAQRPAEGVEPLGTVEREGGDAVLHLVEQALVAHASLLKR